jgi:acyl dehydratase
MANELYFEDFTPGQRFNSSLSVKVTAEEIKDFAQKYDPQPFHLDESAGESSFFAGLAASGWLTAALVMRMRVTTLNVAGGMIGAGVQEIRWTKPVRPNDTIRSEIEIVSTRVSVKRPALGMVQVKTLTYNQRNEVVMNSTVNFLAPRRTTA